MLSFTENILFSCFCFSFFWLFWLFLQLKHWNMFSIILLDIESEQRTSSILLHLFPSYFPCFFPSVFCPFLFVFHDLFSSQFSVLFDRIKRALCLSFHCLLYFCPASFFLFCISPLSFISLFCVLDCVFLFLFLLGSLMEGLSSNFFVIASDCVWTAEEGILPGTVRDIILSLCAKHDIPVIRKVRTE